MAINAKSFLKWNPITAAPYAVADHFGAVNAAESLLSPKAATTPTLAPVTPPPEVDMTAMTAAAERRRRRIGLVAPAKAGTLLTGPSGLTAPAPTERTSLLGG